MSLYLIQVKNSMHNEPFGVFKNSSGQVNILSNKPFGHVNFLPNLAPWPNFNSQNLQSFFDLSFFMLLTISRLNEMMESSIVMESSTIDEESSVTASTSGGNDPQIFNHSIEQKADPQGTLSFGLKGKWADK